MRFWEEGLTTVSGEPRQESFRLIDKELQFNKNNEEIKLTNFQGKPDFISAELGRKNFEEITVCGARTLKDYSDFLFSLDPSNEARFTHDRFRYNPTGMCVAVSPNDFYYLNPEAFPELTVLGSKPIRKASTRSTGVFGVPAPGLTLIKRGLSELGPSKYKPEYLVLDTYLDTVRSYLLCMGHCIDLARGW